MCRYVRDSWRLSSHLNRSHRVGNCLYGVICIVRVIPGGLVGVSVTAYDTDIVLVAVCMTIEVWREALLPSQ